MSRDEPVLIERSFMLRISPPQVAGPLAGRGLLYFTNVSPGLTVIRRMRLDLACPDVLFFMVQKVEAAPSDPFAGTSFGFPTPTYPVQAPCKPRAPTILRVSYFRGWQVVLG
jgi:hypothetical protein